MTRTNTSRFTGDTPADQGIRAARAEAAVGNAAAATNDAIFALQGLLNEAQGHLESGEHLAALGALLAFDEHAEAVQAGIRLLKMAARR